MVTTSPRRRITILSTLTIVAFGAVALTGLWHPNAPTEAMQLYLPRITLPTAAVFLTHLGLGIGLLKTLDFFHASISPCQAGRARRDSVWPVDDQGFLPARHGMASASSITGGQACATNEKKAIVPALVLDGFLIGLSTVPCSGAVYLGVLSLLALQQSAMIGYGYLVLYNLIFVLPLVIILIAASARPTLNRLAHWNLHHREWVQLALGGVVVMGLLILSTV